MPWCIPAGPDGRRSSGCRCGRSCRSPTATSGTRSRCGACATWLRATAPRLVLTIGRRASALTRRARRRLPQVVQVGVTPNYSLGPLIGLDHVLATTSDLRAALIAAGQPPDRISVVPNLVRAPPEVVMAEADPGRAPVIGALGRFVAKKGFADLLEALARLRDRGQRFEALLAGSGPEEAALRALATRLDLDGRVRFLGWVDDKRSFFAALDLLCVPSREEPFGIAVLEGMAHGRATIATDAAGPREIVRDGVDGLLVPRAAPDALAAAMALLLDAPGPAAGAGARRARDGARPLRFAGHCASGSRRRCATRPTGGHPMTLRAEPCEPRRRHHL